MNWWGKLIGTGVGMFGGPIGALAGAAIGHLYDEDDPTLKMKESEILYLAIFLMCSQNFESRWRNFNQKLTPKSNESFGLG